MVRLGYMSTQGRDSAARGRLPENSSGAAGRYSTGPGLGAPPQHHSQEGNAMQKRNGARPWGKHGARGALIAGTAAVACCLTAPASAGTSRALAGPVSATPENGTPTLANTGTTEQIRQLVQCGTTMYAVGTITQIKSGGTTDPRNNAFSFGASTPFGVTSWDPNVNGTV